VKFTTSAVLSADVRLMVKTPLVGPASVAVALLTVTDAMGGSGGAVHPAGTP
jgi:hypothetical protein